MTGLALLVVFIELLLFGRSSKGNGRGAARCLVLVIGVGGKTDGNQLATNLIRNTCYKNTTKHL